MTTERKMKKLGDFNEVFWNHKEGDTLKGMFKGTIEKKIDDEKRTFAVIEVEGEAKPFICGGRDLLNKLEGAEAGKYVEITFRGKETFTPKGSKKKVPINRYDVAIEL